MLKLAIVLIASLGALPALADGFRPITSKSDFLSLVTNRALLLPLYGGNLKVSPDGRIRGVVAGRAVTGNWRWNAGFFCRDLYWGSRDLGPNCQEVRAAGNRVRFTENRGSGRSADFRLR